MSSRPVATPLRFDFQPFLQSESLNVISGPALLCLSMMARSESPVRS
jgi:hypothetical protein